MSSYKTRCLLFAASAALVTAALTIAGCGFQLRGTYELPYKAVYVAAPSTSVVASIIRRELVGAGGGSGVAVKVLPSLKDADAQLNILEERRDRQILSLSGAGRVREYDLRMTVLYQLEDSKGQTVIPTSEIRLSRILAYDDSKIIAKQQEEATLYSDMEKDAVGQILRRMVAVGRNDLRLVPAANPANPANPANNSKP